MSTQTVQPVPDNAAWLAERKKGLGGSDVAAVFSEDYGCARALAYDKLGIEPDFQRTDREKLILRRGTRMEELVADEYSEVTGRKIRRMATRVSKEHPFMRVNVDRQIVNDERGPGVLECKTANPWVFKKFKTPVEDGGGLSNSYILQMQHSFAVTGYTWGAFAVMNASSWELMPFEFTPNPKLISTIIEREEKFWGLVQLGGLPDPLPKENDKRCASCLWRKSCRGKEVIEPEEDGTVYQADDSLAELAIDYRDAVELAEAQEQIVDTIKEQLQTAVGSRQGVTIPSIGYRIRYATQKGRQTWDGKGLQSTIDQWKKGDESAQANAALIEKCRKIGAPTRPFYVEEIR